MKIKDIIIEEESFEGNKYNSVFFVTIDNKKIRIGTLKTSKNGAMYIITPQKKQYNK